jgi:hypothetical protein
MRNGGSIILEQPGADTGRAGLQEQAELNALQRQCEWCFGTGMISHRQSTDLRRPIPENPIREMNDHGTTARGAKRPLAASDNRAE